ncbi:MAG: hypothetical protein ACE5RJ_01600, partial [Nitrosopumilaceae archaeon]
MNKILFFVLLCSILPFFSAFVETSSNGSFLPFAFGERFYDYEKIINPDGSITQTLGLTPWIEDGGEYVPFVFSDQENHLTVETEHGSVKLHKTSCAFEFYSNGRISEPVLDDEGNVIEWIHKQSLFIDSIVPLMADNGTMDFSIINSINNASCQPSWNGQELTAKKETSAGRLEYKYILNNGKWKTQLEATNLSSLTDKKFGFTQTIDLNKDTVKFGNQVRNIDNFDGMSFDRTFIENNESKLLDLFNGFYYDFDLAYDNLNQINVFDTGPNKSKLSFDFVYNTPVVLPNETLIIDPTFGNFDATAIYRSITDAQTGTSCATATSIDSSNLNVVTLSGSATNSVCRVFSAEFNISNLPTTADITDVDFIYDITSVSNPINCDFWSMEGQPSTLTASQMWDDVLDGTEYVDNDATCTTTGSKTVDLGTNGDAELQQRLDASDNWFAIGFRFDNMVRDAPFHQIIASAETLTVTYNIPPDPPGTFFGNAFDWYGVDMTWINGTLNGDTHQGYLVQRYNATSTTWVQLTNTTNQYYVDSNPILDQNTTKYRIYDDGVLGTGCYSFLMNGTLSTNLVSYYPLCYTLNNNGLIDDVGEVLGFNSN